MGEGGVPGPEVVERHVHALIERNSERLRKVASLSVSTALSVISRMSDRGSNSHHSMMAAAIREPRVGFDELASREVDAHHQALFG